jgi:hypothetical protein
MDLMMLGATKRSRVAFLLAVCLLLGAQQAAAVIFNPSFETGDTSRWSTVGGVSVTDSSFGVDPVDGSYQILLTTNGASASETESAMGLASSVIQNIFDQNIGDPGQSTGSGPIEGSAFQQTFDVTASGDSVTFYYNLLTNASVPESLSTDFVWWNLDRPVGADTSGVIAHANEAVFSPSGTGYDYETGYQTFTINFSKTGSYTLTLGVHDVEDTFGDSAALFDSFWLRRSPEPNTFLLLAAGLLGLAVHARSVKKTNGKD